VVDEIRLRAHARPLDDPDPHKRPHNHERAERVLDSARTNGVTSASTSYPRARGLLANICEASPNRC
jgi:hypothetical protein